MGNCAAGRGGPPPGELDKNLGNGDLSLPTGNGSIPGMNGVNGRARSLGALTPNGHQGNGGIEDVEMTGRNSQGSMMSIHPGRIRTRRNAQVCY